MNSHTSIFLTALFFVTFQFNKLISKLISQSVPWILWYIPKTAYGAHIGPHASVLHIRASCQKYLKYVNSWTLDKTNKWICEINVLVSQCLIHMKNLLNHCLAMAEYSRLFLLSQINGYLLRCCCLQTESRATIASSSCTGIGPFLFPYRIICAYWRHFNFWRLPISNADTFNVFKFWCYMCGST